MRAGLVTTNVRMTRDKPVAYQEYALREGKSFSQLVRDVLARVVNPARVARVIGKRTLREMAEISVSFGDKKASSRTDEIYTGR